MKRNLLTKTFFLIIMILLSCALEALQAQDLHVKMSASREVVGPGDYTTYVLTASNTGSTDLSNVTVMIQLPDHIYDFGKPADFSCYYSNSCKANTNAKWNIGTLAPGKTRIAYYRVRVSTSATETTIMSTATASASNSDDAKSSIEIAIDPTPLLRLILTSSPGPAIPGKPITYKLKYGNIGSNSPSNVVIKMPVPDGTTFNSANHGGTVQNDTVVWNLGQVGVGEGGEVRMVATADKNLGNGHVIKAVASIDPNVSSEYVVHSSCLLPVHSESPLKIQYGISQTVVEPGGHVTFTLTASNTGSSDLLDLTARILLPGGIADFGKPADFGCYYNSSCKGNTLAIWNIGNLSPGESRTVYFRTQLNSSDVGGEILHSLLTAEGSNTLQVIASQDISVDKTLLLELSVSPDAGPIVAGQPFKYTLTFSNIGTSSPSNVMLHMPVPKGMSFVSATNGGSMSNNIVSWDVGLLGTGVSRSVRVTVMPDANLPEGTIVNAEAWIDPGVRTEYIVHSVAAMPVHTPLPFHIEYAVSQTTVGHNASITYSLTASNSGSSDLLDLAARILLPGDINDFGKPPDFGCYYNSSCRGNTLAIWNIGKLSPGQSKTVFYRTTVGSNARDGDIFSSILTANGSNVGQIVTTLDASVDPTPLLRLNLATSQGPAIPGKRFAYTATFGNIGSQSPSDAVLRLWVPKGAAFDSASHGGILQNGVVTWNIKSFEVEKGGQVRLWIRPNHQLSNGSILSTHAELDPNVSTEEVVQSKAITPVRSKEPLDIDYSVSQSSVMPGNSLTYTIKATNNGFADLPNLAVRILLPGGIYDFPKPADFSCYYSNSCRANTIATWNLGTLQAGKSQSVSFSAKVSSSVALGNVLQSNALSTTSAPGESEHTMLQDVLVGSLIAFNLPPTAPVIASPRDSTSLIIGGANGTSALSPDTPFIVKWKHSIDPENDPVTYHWQLSASDNFSSPLITVASDNGGKDTLYQTTYGNISKILSDDGVAVGDSIMLYDRVVASDGVNITMSDTLHVTLTRGTLTGIEEQPGGIPTVLALHDNYPNPFNPTTTIRYDLPKAGMVRLTVYDVLGRQVAKLINSQQSAGSHVVTFNASGLSSGVYFYRLKANNRTIIKKMMLMK